jgi:hypothetical protein
MKRGIVVLFIVIVAAAAIAAYLLRPAPSPIPVETQQYLKDACLRESESMLSYMQSVRSSDAAGCDAQTGVMNALCAARVGKDIAACDSIEEDVRTTCLALAYDDREYCADDAFCRALSGDLRACASLGLQRFACEAALGNDRAYVTSGRAMHDCEQLVLFEGALESQDRRNCGALEKTELLDECINALPG